MFHSRLFLLAAVVLAFVSLSHGYANPCGYSCDGVTSTCSDPCVCIDGTCQCPNNQTVCQLRESIFTCYNASTTICCPQSLSHGTGVTCPISNKCCDSFSIKACSPPGTFCCPYANYAAACPTGNTCCGTQYPVCVKPSQDCCCKTASSGSVCPTAQFCSCSNSTCGPIRMSTSSTSHKASTTTKTAHSTSTISSTRATTAQASTSKTAASTSSVSTKATAVTSATTGSASTTGSTTGGSSTTCVGTNNAPSVTCPAGAPCCGNNTMSPSCINNTATYRCCVWQQSSAQCGLNNDCCGSQSGTNSFTTCCQVNTKCCNFGIGNNACCFADQVCCGIQDQQSWCCASGKTCGTTAFACN